MSDDFRLGFALVLLDLIITLIPARHPACAAAAELAKALGE